MNELVLTGNDLTVKNVTEAALGQCKISISAEARERIIASNNLVKEIPASAQAVYGISTGVGELSKVYIGKDKNEALQRNLILSHTCAVGDPFPAKVVRAIMLLRLNTLCKGFCGVSPAVTDLLQEMLPELVSMERAASLDSSFAQQRSRRSSRWNHPSGRRPRRS